MSAPRSGLRPARPPRGLRKLGAARHFLMSGPTPLVRFGVIGAGAVGRKYVRLLQEGQVPRAVLSAVCDADASRAAGLPDGCRFFTSPAEMLDAGCVDAVIVSTPAHCRASIVALALERSLGVVADKPVALQLDQAQALLPAVEAHARPVGAMFNHRTDPGYLRLKAMVDAGEFGRLMRISWYVSHYFRTDAYYRQAPWRGTWRGEGGGVLMNQCHHQIDLFVWLFGLPRRVRAFAPQARHCIEVEDSVTAYMAFDNGCEATFVASTHDFPKRDRVDIVGSRASASKEYTRLEVNRFSSDALRLIQECVDPSTKVAPSATPEVVEFADKGPQHAGVLQAYVDAYLGGASLTATWRDGVQALHLANAISLSALQDRWVELPMDPAALSACLGERLRGTADRETANELMHP